MGDLKKAPKNGPNFSIGQNHVNMLIEKLYFYDPPKQAENI